MHWLKYYLETIFIFATFWNIAAPENTVQPPLHVGSFNIQKLGNSKMNNPKVMDIVIQVLLRYDLVLIQEIVTTDERHVKKLLTDLNKFSNSSRYSVVISERLGRGTAKEQYAFLYKENRLQAVKDEVYPDIEDDFMRPPYIVQFVSSTLSNLKSLLAIGIHTQPKNAANETSSMATVYDYTSRKYKEKNAIMMGDMNAGCQNVRISDWANIDLWTREEFDWLISHDVDTTVSDNCCPYDRIVIAGPEMKEAVIWNSVHVFNFRNEYALTTEEALNVSDHWPVEVQLRGGVTDVAAKSVSCKICLEVTDSRPRTLPSEVEKQKTTMGFQIAHFEALSMLTKTAKQAQSLLDDLEKLGAKYPNFVSQELLHTMRYKIKYNALLDQSSTQSFTEEFSIDLSFYKATQAVAAEFCSNTSIN